MADDDETELIALGQQLLAIDIDDTHADTILRRARSASRPSPLRLVEPMATAALTGSYLVWAFLKAIELYR
jgi:hypothetical protein